MARRDFEKILGELGEIRRVVDDPAVGLVAFRKDQEDLRRKVLETVSLGTTGLREENRELRRRQEKMLTDLADVRTGIEALRREVAQAFAPIAGVPMASAAAESASAFELPRNDLQVLEAAGDDGRDGWRGGPVHEITGPADEDGGGREERRDNLFGQGAGSEVTVEPAPDLSASVPAVPVTDGLPADTAVTPSEGAEGAREEDYRQHLAGVLSAAAIASARVICHRDTWAFLIEQTSPHPHFRLPERISELEDGKIETFLSGRSVLAVLVTMRKIRDEHIGSDEDLATWALADAVYRRTQRAVTATTDTRTDDVGVTTIVLDDRPVAHGEAA